MTTTTEMNAVSANGTPTSSEQCDACGAPVEATQRYCVVCATRRRHAPDPAARFMAAASSRARTEVRRDRAATGTRRPMRAAGIGTALVIALIPLGVGLGVLVGRSNSGNDSKLLSTLEKEAAAKPVVVGGTAATAGTTTAATVHSSFPLTKGYAIELSTLPAGSTGSAASSAESAARGKGASNVGLIATSNYTITPAPSGSYVIYSGDFKARAEAQRALARLKRSFSSATVISVVSKSSGGGKVLAKTSYGSATQATGYKPNAAALKTGASVASTVSKKIGKNYVGAQKGLPSVVSVP